MEGRREEEGGRKRMLTSRKRCRCMRMSKIPEPIDRIHKRQPCDHVSISFVTMGGGGITTPAAME